MTAELRHPQARAARRQLLVNRFTDYLTGHGAPEDRATAYARDLLRIVDDSGFALPQALEDTPTPRGPGCTDAGRETAMNQIRAALNPQRHQQEPR